MKVKVNEATGKVLDWMVALTLGDVDRFRTGGFKPSTDWTQGGPIIDRAFITVGPNTRPYMSKGNCAYRAHPFNPEGEQQYGPTPLVAAMRCFVVSNLGDEVDVPEELTT